MKHPRNDHILWLLLLVCVPTECFLCNNLDKEMEFKGKCFSGFPIKTLFVFHVHGCVDKCMLTGNCNGVTVLLLRKEKLLECQIFETAEEPSKDRNDAVSYLVNRTLLMQKLGNGIQSQCKGTDDFRSGECRSSCKKGFVREEGCNCVPKACDNKALKDGRIDLSTLAADCKSNQFGYEEFRCYIILLYATSERLNFTVTGLNMPGGHSDYCTLARMTINIYTNLTKPAVKRLCGISTTPISITLTSSSYYIELNKYPYIYGCPQGSITFAKLSE